MMRIHLLIGLPGCGKTTLGQELLKSNPGAIFIDDANPESPWPAAPVPFMIIASPNFCRAVVRDNALNWLAQKYPSATFEFTYFAPDLATCQDNVRHRADGRNVSPTLSLMARAYDIPPNIPLRPVVAATSLAASPTLLSKKPGLN